MITRRNITVELHPYPHKISNEFWGCSSCNQESNGVEWFISFSLTHRGPVSVYQCPICAWNHEEQE